MLEMHRRHNIFYRDGGCCKAQCDLYRRYGFTKMIMPPVEYLSKMVNYTLDENNKRLNYIRAFYLPRCRANVVTKVGFGSGELLREDHPYIYSPYMPGVPYVLGHNKRNLTHSIPYGNPADFLTFRWFRRNVICRGQPWICMSQQQGGSSSMNTARRRRLPLKSELKKFV